MTTDEKILDCLENTLKKIDELTIQLSKIETNTCGLDEKQHDLEENFLHFQQVVENNNIM